MKKAKKVKSKVINKTVPPRVNEEYQQQQYEDFYTRLRVKIREQLDSWQKKREGKKKTAYAKLVELLFALPDLFHLSVKLLFDKKVPPENKGALVAGIVYVISPIDLIPDVIPVAGWVDDLIVIALALNKFLDTDDGVVADAQKKYWAGDEDVLKAIKRIIEVADSAVRFLPKELMKMTRDIFKGAK